MRDQNSHRRGLRKREVVRIVATFVAVASLAWGSPVVTDAAGASVGRPQLGHSAAENPPLRSAPRSEDRSSLRVDEAAKAITNLGGRSTDSNTGGDGVVSRKDRRERQATVGSGGGYDPLRSVVVGSETNESCRVFRNPDGSHTVDAAR